jgi:hypothetical protein
MIGSSKPVLGRLERVELREAWAGESTGFTPWLAQPRLSIDRCSGVPLGWVQEAPQRREASPCAPNLK